MEATRVSRYPAARIAAEKVYPRFVRLGGAAALPDAHTIEELIDCVFWASLRREEIYSPKISLAFLPPEQAGVALNFEHPLDLTVESELQ